MQSKALLSRLSAAELSGAQRSSVERSEASGVEWNELGVKIKTPRSF